MKALIVLGATLLLSFPAFAHDLRVFASVEGSVVTVETKFSSGRTPVAGEVRVLDGAGELLLTLPMGQGGVTTFELPNTGTNAGLMIEVAAGDGHEDYWLLTPEDIAAGKAKK